MNKKVPQVFFDNFFIQTQESCRCIDLATDIFETCLRSTTPCQLL
jgi:hypothetical protein